MANGFSDHLDSLVDLAAEIASRVATKRIRDLPDVVDDIVQEVIVRVIETWRDKTPSSEEKFKSWVATVTVNIIRDYFRKVKREDRHMRTLVPPIAVSEDDSQQDNIDAVHEAMKGLSTETKLLITLKAEGLTEAEIAAKLDLSIRTVRRRWSEVQETVRRKVDSLLRFLLSLIP